MAHVLCHPSNLDRLKELFPAPDPVSAHPFCETFNLSRLYGINVRTDARLPAERETGRILFPADRFVEYEPSDEGWALALGLAKRERVPMICLIDDLFLPSEVVVEAACRRVIEKFERDILAKFDWPPEPLSRDRPGWFGNY